MIDSQCSIVKLRNISSRRLGEVVFEDVNASINAVVFMPNRFFFLN
jgi:hypothetical protein